MVARMEVSSAFAPGNRRATTFDQSCDAHLGFAHSLNCSGFVDYGSYSNSLIAFMCVCV